MNMNLVGVFMPQVWSRCLSDKMEGRIEDEIIIEVVFKLS
jgi:hypothetical protein